MRGGDKLMQTQQQAAWRVFLESTFIVYLSRYVFFHNNDLEHPNIQLGDDKTSDTKNDILEKSFVRNFEFPAL